MEFFESLRTLGTGQIILLLVALVIAFGFEVINGFHDTANAVATVIYTKSLKPNAAVMWSRLWNFIGVHAGGIAVAFSIVHLLPVDLLVNIKSGRGPGSSLTQGSRGRHGTDSFTPDRLWTCGRIAPHYKNCYSF